MTEEPDAVEQEREMREHEREARERDSDERSGSGESGLPKNPGEVDPVSDPDDTNKPAPPGQVQQPRG